MSDSEIGEGAKPKMPSASSSRPRSSRYLPRLNYKKLNEGEHCYDQSGEVDVSQETEKDSLVFHTESPSGASKFTHTWDFPIHNSNMAGAEQISVMKKELEALDQEEERLRQRKEADDLRRHLADGSKGVNIETLRKSKRLRHRVNKQIKQLIKE